MIFAQYKGGLVLFTARLWDYRLLSMNTEQQRRTVGRDETQITSSEKRAPAPNPLQAVPEDFQPHEWSPSMTLCQRVSRSPFRLGGLAQG